MKIIDVGAGDSLLVDFLIGHGYENVTALDISKRSFRRAKLRLGEKANKINWIVKDINKFIPYHSFNIWHDRAMFHFLTKKKDIDNYLKTVEQSVLDYLIIATFSKKGPKKCSGLNITQYSESDLELIFSKDFEKIESINIDHSTLFREVTEFFNIVYSKKKKKKLSNHDVD